MLYNNRISLLTWLTTQYGLRIQKSNKNFPDIKCGGKPLQNTFGFGFKCLGSQFTTQPDHTVDMYENKDYTSDAPIGKLGSILESI